MVRRNRSSEIEARSIGALGKARNWPQTFTWFNNVSFLIPHFNKIANQPAHSMPDSPQHHSNLEALVATVPLGRLPRTGWLMSGVPYPESIAAHSHGVSLVVLALGPAVSPSIDVDRAVSLAAVHDVPEALISDLPRPGARLFPAGAKRAAEEAAARELLTPLSALAHERFREYLDGQTREARFVRLCDRLHLGVMLVAYLRAGARGLDDFIQTMTELDTSEFPACQKLGREIQNACGEFAP